VKPVRNLLLALGVTLGTMGGGLRQVGITAGFLLAGVAFVVLVFFLLGWLLG
jgi:hypothetical protein